MTDSAPEAPPPPPATRVAADFFREHSGFVLTAGYLALIAIGMMYEFWLFWRFRISILYYAEAADFLLVPFREPLVILVALAPIPIFRLYMRGAKALGTKLAKPNAKPLAPAQAAFYRKFMLAVNVLAMALWSLVATAEFAEFVSNRIRAGKRRTVRIVTTASPQPIAGTIIGTTSQWVFLYDPRLDQTRMIPVENVGEILVERKKKK